MWFLRDTGFYFSSLQLNAFRFPVENHVIMSDLRFIQAVLLFTCESTAKSLKILILLLNGLRPKSIYSHVNKFAENKKHFISRFARPISSSYLTKRPWGKEILIGVLKRNHTFRHDLANLWRWHSTALLVKAITTEQHMVCTKNDPKPCVTYPNVCSSSSVFC